MDDVRVVAGVEVTVEMKVDVMLAVMGVKRWGWW